MMQLRFQTALRSLALVALLGPALPAAQGQVVYTPTLHREYQAVFNDGTSAWPASPQQPKYPIEMTGVVINNPGDMLYFSDDPQSPYYSDSPQWQVYIQATEAAKAAGDFGGTALYMRRYAPPFLGGHDLYPGTAWADEMTRLNYPVYDVTGDPVTEPLQQGDLIKVEARAPGMFFRGKNNVNTMHLNLEQNEFYITILERDVPLAAPTITLADLKNPDDTFLFDETRQTGPEHYQASLVHLENLLLDDDPSNWTLDNTVTVRQGDLTFDMQLGIDPALELIDATTLTTTPFDVTAIVNQEDPSDPYTGTYRLWMTSAGNLTVIPEPGTVLLLALGLAAGVFPLRRSRFRRTAR